MERNEINKVCLLAGSNTIPDWMAASISELVAKTEVEFTLVVVACPPQTNKMEDQESIQNDVLDSIRGIYNSLTERNPSEPVHVDNVTALNSAEYIRCTYQDTEKIGINIPDNVVSRISESSDIVIHTGVGILQGDILHATEHGVLSFHHGDFRKYRGTPAGFWEFMNDESFGGVTVQQLTEQLDAGYVVAFEPVDIADASTWRAVRERLYNNSETMLTRAIKNLENPDWEPERVPSDELGTLYYEREFNYKARLVSRFKELKQLLLR